MSPAETRLLQLLTERSFRRGSFRLASGGTSTYYIDGKMTEVFSEAAALIGQVLYERTKDLAIDAIGGLEVGAVPLTTAAVLTYHLHGARMEGFWVRDRAKDHGTCKHVEGNLQPGARVVIVDDVITKGTSSLKAIREVRALGCRVVRVLALVDRLEGARENFQAAGIEDFQAIFTIRDFGVAP
ncbi:MAG: orotate phosphoribosyltransferase [Gemmataceae bacterium]|nr:orotate phosphoribosyltransferase [Gemmataceae bacterium]